MIILAIETSGQAASIGLVHHEKITAKALPADQKHSETILTHIQALLAENRITLNQLTAVSFTHGPGSFTGLRIASSLVQAIAFAKNIPVIPIDTLATIAQQAYEQHHLETVITVLDARMSEVFIAAYQRQDSTWETIISPTLASLDQLPDLPEKNWMVVGEGALVSQIAKTYTLDYRDDVSLTAEALLSLAVSKYKQQAFISADEAQPVYIRNKVALTMAEQKQR